MAHKKFLLGILGMALVFGMTAVGCDNGITDSGTDSALNGTWVSGSGNILAEQKLDNGNTETVIDGTLAMKGTYTTSDGKITSRITAVHGDYYTKMSGGSFTLESKWYSKNDLKAALGMSDEDFEKGVGSMFSETTATYSVSGNTLTTTSNEGVVMTATRK